MSKEDIEIRKRPPRKRKHLEQALDVELATWENDPKLTPSERRKAHHERDRRKEAADETIVVLLRPREGLTPEQRKMAGELVKDADVNRFWGGSGAYQPTIKGATLVVACPKEMTRPEQAPGGSVWAAARYARHRNIAVRVIMPDGTEGEP